MNPYQTNIFIKICIIICLVFFSSTAGAQDKPHLKNIPVYNSTILLNLKPINCRGFESNKINNLIYKALPSIPFIVLLDKTTVKDAAKTFGLSNECSGKDCAMKFAQAVVSQRVICGSIKKIEDDKEKLMGDEGKYKYLLNKKTNVSYELKIILYDASDNNKLIEINIFTKESELSNAVKNIINKLKPFYKEELKPVEVYIEPYIEPAEVKEPPVQNKKKIFNPVLSFQGEFLFPTSTLKQISKFGAGLSVYPGIYFPDINISLCAYLSYSYFNPDNSNAKIYMLNKTGLQLSYQYKISLKISVNPGFSCGYIIHYLEKKNETGIRMYRDPFLQPEINLRVNFSENLFFYAGPAYVLFFEKGHTGNIIQFNAGITNLWM